MATPTNQQIQAAINWCTSQGPGINTSSWRIGRTGTTLDGMTCGQLVTQGASSALALMSGQPSAGLTLGGILGGVGTLLTGGLSPTNIGSAIGQAIGTSPSSSGTCSSGQVLINGKCYTPAAVPGNSLSSGAATTPTCPSGQYSILGQCISLGTGGYATSTGGTTCPSGQVAIGGVCYGIGSPSSTSSTGGVTVAGGTVAPTSEIATAPVVHGRRVCGKGRRLAKDGLCYPKGMKPAVGWESPHRRAPVTWRDKHAIQVASRTKKRLVKLTNEAGAHASESRPRRREK